MTTISTIIKAKRDLIGLVTIDFKDSEGKEFNKTFTHIKAGICWPLRDKPGYVCIVGLLSGAQIGQKDSMMLIYEREYKTNTDMMLDISNLARDLRISELLTDRKHHEFQAYNSDFDKYIKAGLPDLRLTNDRFASDFQYGLNVIRRWAKDMVIKLPVQSKLAVQLHNISLKDLESERPDLKFNAVNAFRYLVCSYERQKIRPYSEQLGFKENIPVNNAAWT